MDYKTSNLLIQVQHDPSINPQRLAKVLQYLIDKGLEEAARLLSLNEGDIDVATLATNINIHSPKPTFNHTTPALEPAGMTGLMVSMDNALTWHSTHNCRILFHDALEDDDGMADLLLNLSPEGAIFDLQSQATGLLRTANMPVDCMVNLTR